MIRRVRFFLQRRRMRQELQEEMEFHAAAAGERFGDATRWRERSEDEWGGHAFDELSQDIRYGLRSLRRQPLFAVTAFLLLALGVSVNSAIFTLVRTAVLSPLPVRDPNSLVQLGYDDAASSGFRINHTHVALDLFTSHARTVRDLFAFSQPLEINLTYGGNAELAHAQAITGNAWEVLNLGTAMNPSSVLLTYGYWQRRFGGDVSVVGRSLNVNSVPFTIAGVLPPEFRSLSPGDKPDLFFHTDRVNEVLMRNLRNPGNMWLKILGRLQPGVSIEQARAELEPLSSAAKEELYRAVPAGMLPEIRKMIDGFRIRVIPASRGAHSELRDTVRTRLLTLLGSSALLLLVACANLAGLMLARSVSRQREAGIRVALGCGRARLMRQMMSESLLLAMAAGAAALIVEPWARRMLIDMLGVNDVFHTSPELPTGFVILISVLTGIVAGSLPAWRASRSARLVEDRTTRSSRLTSGLIAVQVALSLVLIAGAGMFVQTFRSYRDLDPGYTRERLITFTVNPGTLRYSDERLLSYYRGALEELRRVPGVKSATIMRWPMGGLTWTTIAKANETRDNTGRNLAGSQFAATVGLPLMAGRDFTESDERRRTALVNEAFARKFFAGSDPLGKQVSFMDAPDRGYEIIGVVQNARDSGPKSSVQPVVYNAWENDRMAWLTFSVRTLQEPEVMMASIREVLRSIDSAVPVGQMSTADAMLDRQLARERMMAVLGIVFGGLALAVAAVGLYALLAHSVARRTREIGVRMAIGASRSRVIGLVLRQATVLLAAGAFIGIPLAAAASWVLRNQLYGIAPADPVLLSGACAVMIAAGVLAAAVPAWRAMRVDPIRVLRHE